MSVLFSKVDFGKVEKGAGRGTRRVLPWHVFGSEYLQGTAEGWKWSCVIDRD
jgi:hypothetical protein